MITRIGRRLVGTALVGLLAGCGAGSTPAAPGSTPPAAPAASAVEPTAGAGGPGPGRDDPACADYATTVSTVRGIADALQRGPVLPAGVALFLIGPRTRAAASDAGDQQLTAARAELVAAIDDLDAQGRALLPAGGNPARDLVQLDPTRILAAVAEFERVCRSG